MNTQQLIELGEQLASEVRQYADENRISRKDALMALVVAERLLQRVLFDTESESRRAVLEGHATFDAVSAVPQTGN
jgi:hypothetical protein